MAAPVGRPMVGDTRLTMAERSRRHRLRKAEEEAALLELLDRIAVLNAGSVRRNGRDYILVQREDWEALMRSRGTDAEVLARLDARGAAKPD